VVHKGKLENGHYFCYVRRKNQWYKCDDSIITKVTRNQVASAQAYLLFYIRRTINEHNENTNKHNENTNKHASAPHNNGSSTDVDSMFTSSSTSTASSSPRASSNNNSAVMDLSASQLDQPKNAKAKATNANNHLVNPPPRKKKRKN